MANTAIGLTDLVKLNDLNARDLGITDLLNDAPFLKVLHATTASNGTLHHYIKQTAAPVVGFRAVNTGKANGASGYTEIDVTLKNLDPTFYVDKAVADGYRYGPEAFVGREAVNQLKAGFFYFEQQIWYGTGAGDAAGFSGLGDNSLYSALAGAEVVNAAGTTATTGSSIWLIRTTPDELEMTAVIGNSGEINIGQTVVTLKPDDSDATKSFPVYYTPINAYCGLQIGSAFSATRIGNITADAGHKATDALISLGISKFPAARPPTHIVMNRRSLQQLQASRTATNPSGNPAPFPTESFGVPIVVTDSISSTETLLT